MESKNKKINKTIIIFAVTIIFVLAILLITQFIMMGVEKTRERELEEAIERVEGEIESIENSIEYRESMLFLEKIAREQLELYGDGDIVFVPKG